MVRKKMIIDWEIFSILLKEPKTLNKIEKPFFSIHYLLLMSSKLLLLESYIEKNKKNRKGKKREASHLASFYTDSGGIRTHAFYDWCLKPAP